MTHHEDQQMSDGATSGGNTGSAEEEATRPIVFNARIPWRMIGLKVLSMLNPTRLEVAVTDVRRRRQCTMLNVTRSQG